ncbi:MAG: hypothetical protein Pg6C_04920 [Treponemataceae bacterium]|nr:MAG: hypothetical protein Pg6C_04920 [Treponemataceae bacterium]
MNTRQPLDKNLRTQLEKTVCDARLIAEKAARVALDRLGAANPKPYNSADKELHKKLRAHGLQLGDSRDSANGTQRIDLLAEETAYQYWHRMLFARFLAENNLLMYFETSTPVPVSLADCEELAKEKGIKGIELAARSAAKMLPQIFRLDSPVFDLPLASNYIQDLEKLVNALSHDIFLASDSLGWIYQFWQAKRKDDINRTNKKIGARELPAVTQLFTEPYMVSFLLDNSLGAWWATRALSEADLKNAQTEDELRQKAALPGLPLKYLRFAKDAAGSWIPAAGTFEDWPKELRDFKALDPCCGSGHFLVAALQMLVPIRCNLENLSVKDAIDAVLRDNIHGLELDMRCVEIAAFNLAFTAWTFPEAEGWRKLPELQVACSGLSVGASKEDWVKIGAGNTNLEIALGWMYDYFKNAPVLGSLLNPTETDAAVLVHWEALIGALEKALTLEDNYAWHEAAVVAQGLAKAAQLLSGKYHWVITNPPWLTSQKQDTKQIEFSASKYPKAKNDLAIVFLERCLDCCNNHGTVGIVLPQNWLFLPRYKQFREKLLKNEAWHLLAQLGSGAFETISGEVVKAILLIISNIHYKNEQGLFSNNEVYSFKGVDISKIAQPIEKSSALIKANLVILDQNKQLKNVDARVVLNSAFEGDYLSNFAYSRTGTRTADNPLFLVYFWEVQYKYEMWIYEQTSINSSVHYGGRTYFIRWEKNKGKLLEYKQEGLASIQGQEVWNKDGIILRLVGHLPATIYSGQVFDMNTGVICPKKPEYLLPLWAFCSSEEYSKEVRKIDQQLKLTTATLVKVPFDLDHWQKIAAEKYPHGLPKPYSDDPTQWIFHGHPCGSVIWDEDTKKLIHGPLRRDKTVLHIACARLLGYRWPAEQDAEMELAAEQREWVKRCGELSQFASEDGIVPIPAMRKEQSAENRLLGILQASYGSSWSAAALSQLLQNCGCEGKNLEYWLRNEFFSQHCELFGQRPFIWHIWDGLKDGFSVLVNYHKLDSRLLDSLIYTYLGDWISRQERDKGRADNAAERLDAARSLQKKLMDIQKGEAPLDIFARWKPLDEQPIGWNPDLNDGVRINIRPFMSVSDVKVKGAGVLRTKPKIEWKNDRGSDAESAPWYNLGPSRGLDKGTRINDHHLTLEEKQKARDKK